MQENKSSRAFLIVSVCLGVVAMVLSFAYLQGKTGDEAGPEMTILVAAHDLKANTALDPDKDLKELKISAKLTDLQRRALNPLYRESYHNQRINRDILDGTPVFEADLVASADLDIPPGYVAMAISVRGANALSGLLNPGDYVKLLVTRPTMRARTLQPGQADSTSGTSIGGPAPSGIQGWETITVEPEPLKVLAVGSRMTRNGRQVTLAEQYNSARENEATQSVTLLMTEPQSHNIEEQMGGGQFPITLILCPPPPKPAALVTPAAPATSVAPTTSK